MSWGDVLGGFGSGIGQILGANMANSRLNQAQTNINNIGNAFTGQVQPYNQFGQSFLSPATGAINNINSVAGADPNLNYNTFMQNYQTSPAAKYEMGVANAAQNNTAAAIGGQLSGSNLRALGGIDTGITNTYANNAYTNYLAGNKQMFGQLNQALSNMFQGIGVGTTATGQLASVDTSQMYADANIAGQQATNDRALGGGIGALFGGFGSGSSGNARPLF